MFDKLLKIIFIFLIFLLLYVCIFGNIFFAIRMNWEIKLPNADKVVYMSDTCSKSHSICPTYIVAEYNSNRKIKKLSSINWKTEKDVNIETKILAELSNVVIDKKNMINFTDEYWYYQIVDHDDQLFLVYFPKTNLLYIIEQFNSIDVYVDKNIKMEDLSNRITSYKW